MERDSKTNTNDACRFPCFFLLPVLGKPCSSIAREVRREARDARLQTSPPSVCCATSKRTRKLREMCPLPAWVVGLYTLDGYQQVLEGRRACDGVPSGGTTMMPTPIAQTTTNGDGPIVEQTPMASAARPGCSQRPQVMAHKVFESATRHHSYGGT